MEPVGVCLSPPALIYPVPFQRCGGTGHGHLRGARAPPFSRGSRTSSRSLKEPFAHRKGTRTSYLTLRHPACCGERCESAVLRWGFHRDPEASCVQTRHPLVLVLEVEALRMKVLRRSVNASSSVVVTWPFGDNRHRGRRGKRHPPDHCR